MELLSSGQFSLLPHIGVEEKAYNLSGHLGSNLFYH
nr:MAG TPA: hypothetical protein [Caudoviricetes sp.]